MWHTSIHGEYASKNQYANEQLQIGGPYTVRGYLKQTMLGNAGIYMRNDLAWSLPTQAMKCDGYQFFCEALIQGTELYGIFDVGMTRGIFTYAGMPKTEKGGNLVGAGIGIQKLQEQSSGTPPQPTPSQPQAFPQKDGSPCSASASDYNLNITYPHHRG